MQKRIYYQSLARFMRLSFIQLITIVAALGNVYALEGNAQPVLNRKVNLNIRNQAVENVFREIEQRTDVRFVFSRSLIRASRKVSITAKNQALHEVLDEILTPLNLKYRASENLVIISRMDRRDEELINSVAPYNGVRQTAETSNTNITITGRVSDEKGEALPGVSIMIKGTQTGTATRADGSFSLDVPDEKTVLVFSYVGYVSQEVVVSGKTRLEVTLEVDEKALEEVVVVGYGTQRKANLTGAVSTIKMDDVLGSRPLSNAATALQGAIPGLQITSSSGRPGATVALNIRGINSINGGAPLVLVDNVPMSMDNINPNDIQSVTVLKDAAAASIYGARAAFGVILITTRQGKKNQPVQFEYSVNLVSSRATDIPEKATTAEMARALKDWGTTAYYTGQVTDTWLDYLEQYRNNPGAFPEGIAYHQNGQRYPLRDNPDLLKEFYDRGFEHIHNFSFSGGSEKTSFRVGLGHVNENGVMVTSKDSYKRYNINTFLQSDLTKNLTATVNLLYNNNTRINPPNEGELFSHTISLPPYAPTGMATLSDGTTLPYKTSGNIIKIESPQKNSGDNLRLFGRLNYRITEGLNLVGEYTFNKTVNNIRTSLLRNQYVNAETFNTQFVNNISRYTRVNSQSDYHALNLYADYSKTWSDAHNFKILIGTNQESSSFENFQISRDDLISPAVPSLSTSTGVIAGADRFEEYAVSGYFGRINYDYRNKYLLEANGRFDGSSRFARGDRFGFFPSVSAGWVVSEEPFMLPVRKIVDELKLRGSLGEIGNQVMDSFYPSIPGLESYLTNWIDPGTNIRYLSLKPPLLVSSGFTWETVRTLNFGIDISLLNGRISTSFDIFKRSTLNMLTKGSELPASLGTEAPLQNAADLKSKGWEWELRWKDGSNHFKYSVGFNLSDNRGFITRIDNANGLISDYYVGQQIGDIWGYTTEGFYTVSDFEEGSLNANLMGGKLKAGTPAFRGVSPNPGDVKFKDLNGDGEIFSGNSTLSNPGDRSVIGNNNRRFQYGVSGNLSYRQFDFSIFLQGIGKRDLWISNVFFWPYFTEFAVVHKNHLDYWTPERPDAYFPRGYAAAAGNSPTNRHVQTRYLSNGAYMRIRNISLGYTLPEGKLKPVNRLRLFATAENPFTFKHLPAGMDPEVAVVGSGAGYAFLKKYNLGLNITF